MNTIPASAWCIARLAGAARAAGALYAASCVTTVARTSYATRGTRFDSSGNGRPRRRERVTARAPTAAAAAFALVLGSWATSSSAESFTYKLHCQDSGYSAAQPVGDRDGHAVQVSEYTCRYEGGPLDGATMSGQNTWEWDKTSAVLLSGSGVVRKGGAVVAAFQHAEGKLTATVGGDGKIAGWTASGRGSSRMASGVATKLGKAYTWTASPTGADQFTTEVKHD